MAQQRVGQAQVGELTVAVVCLTQGKLGGIVVGAELPPHILGASSEGRPPRTSTVQAQSLGSAQEARGGHGALAGLSLLPRYVLTSAWSCWQIVAYWLR